eukprot:scaffold15730_cov65-Phaeocystis_antarctica.AAC.7
MKLTPGGHEPPSTSGRGGGAVRLESLGGRLLRPIRRARGSCAKTARGEDCCVVCSSEGLVNCSGRLAVRVLTPKTDEFLWRRRLRLLVAA